MFYVTTLIYFVKLLPSIEYQALTYLLRYKTGKIVKLFGGYV